MVPLSLLRGGGAGLLVLEQAACLGMHEDECQLFIPLAFKSKVVTCFLTVHVCLTCHHMTALCFG